MNTKSLLKLILVFSCVYSATSSAAEKIDKIYYRVTFDPSLGVIGSLEKSLTSSKNKAFYGYTNTRITWSWEYQIKRNSCKIKKIKSILIAQIELPSIAKKELPLNYLEDWNLWTSHLEAHEIRHIELARLIAKNGIKELKEIKRQKNCDEINKQANLIVKNKINELKVRNHDYDVKTKHGKTEGASPYDYFK